MRKLLFIFAAVLLSSIGLHAGNTITYKATAILTGYNSSLNVGETTFGPRITSHEFSDSIGTITCAGEITKIDNNAFQRNPSLRAIEIPSSVKTIGTNAFYSCTYLRDIEIPSSVTEIGAYAFYNCASLALVKVNWTDAQPIVPIDNTVFRQIANGAILLVPAGTVDLYRDANGWMDFSNIVDPAQITYTASAQLNRTWLSIGAVTFGSPIVAHDFSNGVGTIVCAGPITKIGTNAFLDCFGLMSLTSIQIPNTVSAIEEQAFYNCTGLTSIEIPSSVTTIGYNAFHECIGLTSIVVENGNTKYDSRDNCNAIVETATNKLLYGCQNTIIPSSITAIEDGAFFNFRGISSVKVDWTDAQSIASLGNDVFAGIANGAGPAGAMLYVPAGTYNLYHQANGWKDFGSIVDLDNKITYTASAQLTGYNGSLNEGATTFGSRIFSHTFSNGVGTIICDGPITQIGDNAFQKCTGLKSITIPNTTTKIETCAFDSCIGLASVALPSSVKMIYYSAFKDCSGLTSITISDSVTEIGSYAFENCTSLTSIEIPNSVTRIESGAFLKCTGLKSVEISNSITTIERYTFQECTGLTSVTIPSSVTRIDDWAFWKCRSLTNVKIPNSVTWIGISVFEECSSLTSVTIPSSAQRITYHAFRDCSSLTSVTVNWTDAQSIVSIDNDVFERIANGAGPSGARLYVPAGTYNLYNQANGWKDFIITVPNSTITYTASAQLPGYDGSLDVGKTTFGPRITSHEFSDSIGTITCAGEVTTIGRTAFQNCRDLTSVTIPKTVTTIGTDAFDNCSSLTSVEIPSSVTTIKERAFMSCSSLTSITIPNSVTEIGKYAFMYCSSLSSVTISNSVTTIDEQTFNHCSSLTLVNIPNSVTTIKNMSFRACASLTSIEIPNSVTQIEGGTFMECSNLQSVYCYALTPPSRVGSTIFTNQPTVYTFNTGAYIEGWSELPASCFKPISAEVGDFKYEFFDGNKARVVAKDGGYTGSVTIPTQVSYMEYTFTVTEIGTSAFQDCSGLTSITIPTSVKEIKDWAFKNCTNLKDLDFAERERTDAITVGKYAFENLAIEEVAIPEWMAVVPEGLFYSNKKLRAIYLPANVNHINYRAFEGCDSVKCVISMAATPPTLGANAFVNFKGKNDVFLYVPSPDAITAYKNSNWDSYFPNFTTDIEYNIISTSAKTAEVIRAIPFDGKVAIPAMAVINGDYYTVIGIGKDAFKNDTSLQSISLPPSIQYIGNNAFNGCTQLKQTSIETLEDLQTIGYYAFYGCSALDSIYIPEGVQTIRKRAFMNCSALTSVQLPGSLKAVEDSCFWGCNLQPEVTIPEGTETVGIWSFYNNTKLKTITLPSTLKEIKHGAFEACGAVKEVTCLAVEPPAIEASWAITSQNRATVYVPNRDVLAAYIISNWGSSHYNFKFADLMAEENKKYLYVVAGENDSAKAIAKLYCDSIDNYAITTTAQQVQDYTNRALEKIDKLTLVDYKQALADSLVRHAEDNAEAQLIASQYVPQIINAYFREVAERIFTEADKKIDAIFELMWLKEQYCTQLKNTAKGDPDMEKVADSYSMLIYLAETKEEARALYDRATMRMTINRQINTDWQGTRIKVNNHECTTTRGYIY